MDPADRPQPLTPAAVEFQSDPVAVDLRPLPFPGRLVLYLLLAVLLAAVGWAGWAKVDRIVSAPGKLITSVPTVVLQAFESAAIRSIDVRTGDRVRAGQVLASLDATFAGADVAELEAKLASVVAQETRLLAEVEGGPANFDSQSIEARLQATILASRRAEYASRMAAFDARRERLEAVMTGSRRAQAGMEERVGILDEVENVREQLAQRQVGSRLQLLEARSERLRLRDEMRAERDREREAVQQLAEVVADRAAFVDEWQRKAAEELVSARRERLATSEQLAKARRRRDLVALTAPIDAVVLEIARRSVGSVLDPADPFITLVPLDVPLEIEAEIPAADIARIKVGDPVRIKLTPYPFQQYGTLTGQVSTLSADAFTKPAEQGGAAVFRTRIALGTLPPLPLTPGMEVTAEIQVGQRSVLSYLLYPVWRAFDESLREP